MKLTASDPGEWAVGIPSATVSVDFSYDIATDERSDIKESFKEFLKDLDFDGDAVRWEDECPTCGNRMTIITTYDLADRGRLREQHARYECATGGCVENPETHRKYFDSEDN